MAQRRFLWKTCVFVRCAPSMRPVRYSAITRPLPGHCICKRTRWNLPSTSYCTSSTGGDGEEDSKESPIPDNSVEELSQQLESSEETSINLEEVVEAISTSPDIEPQDQATILDEDDQDALAKTFSKSLNVTSTTDNLEEYTKNFQSFFEHEQEQVVQREAEEFKRLTEDINFESSHQAEDEESRYTLADEDMQSLNFYSEFQDPRDRLDTRRSVRDVEKLSSQRMDTREYLKELEKLPIMFVRCAQNNTYIDICDHTGRILTWKSAGSIGFKKSRRGTTFAAQSVGQVAALKAGEFGFKKVRVKLKGLGIGRQHSLKGFQLGGLEIMSIQDVTPVPHNGCRPKKKRRV